MATSIGQYAPVFLPGETPSLTEKPGMPQSTAWQRVRQDWSDPVHINTRLFFFFCLWQLCPSEAWAWRWSSCLAFGDPGGTKCVDTRAASTKGVTAPSVFSRASCSWRLEGLFATLSLLLCPFRHLERSPWVGSYSVVQLISYLKGQLGWGPTLYFGASGT